MNEHVAIWIIAYLLNGDPQPFTQMLPDGTVCTDAIALDIVRAKAVDQNVAYMDEILWRCFPVPHKDPAEPLNQPEAPLALKRNL